MHLPYLLLIVNGIFDSLHIIITILENGQHSKKYSHLYLLGDTGDVFDAPLLKG